MKKGLDPAHYFNSGVLVFHPRRLRALFPDLMAAVLRLLPELSRPLLYPDQDALNLLFRRLPLRWLGERFNYQQHVAGRWLLRRTSLKAGCSTSVAVNRGASRSALRLSAIWRITVSWSNVALKNEIIHPGKSLIFTGQLHGGAGNAPAAQPHQLT